jgi:hypothetical protein
MRLARHALKVVLAFKLLECRGLPFAELASYVDRVPLYRDFNARFLRLPPQALADALVGDLMRAGAARRDGAMLVPA